MTIVTRKSLICLSLSVATFSFVGCQKEGSVAGPDATPEMATADPHVHPTEGPHHGMLIELGNEEYHAELVHDEAAGSVTVYLLDASGQKAVPIAASELQLNLSHDGEAKQFTLPASPEATDPSGMASRFSSSDAELAEELDHEHSAAQLVVSIEGKQYRGAIQHDHEGDHAPH